MCGVVQINKAIMGGTPTFRGTRVPIQTLFDYIEGGESIDEFMDDFPTVGREDIILLLESLKYEAINKKAA